MTQFAIIVSCYVKFTRRKLNSIIRCIDYRFVTQSRKFKEDAGLKDNDFFSRRIKSIHQLFDAIEVQIVFINQKDFNYGPRGL